MFDTMIALFVALWLGHYAGDYLLQTDRQALGKLDPGRSGLRHACAHVAALTGAQAAWLGVFAMAGAPVSAGSATVALLVNALTHVAIDWVRRGPRAWCYLTGSTGFYDCSQPAAERPEHTHGAERVDQALHYQVLGLAALLGAML